jgi:hypothetical protein
MGPPQGEVKIGLSHTALMPSHAMLLDALDQPRRSPFAVIIRVKK